MSEVLVTVPRMSERAANYYLDWHDGEHNFQPGVALAKSLAKQHGKPLTVVRSNKR